jgi:transcriptional regulator with XRE-family HTH domain
VKTGIQQSEISRIEAAHANPTLGTITVLARALGAGVRLLAGKKRKAGMKAVASRSMKHWFDVGHRRGMLSLVLGDPLMPHFLFALSTPVCGIRAPLHTRRGAATLDSRNGL